MKAARNLTFDQVKAVIAGWDADTNASIAALAEIGVDSIEFSIEHSRSILHLEKGKRAYITNHKATNNTAQSQQPMHLSEPAKDRKVVGFCKGNYIYA